LARKILLADDSVTAQNMGRRILSDAGYEVITVNNGSAALKKIAESKPDLVVLDVYMPGYGGLEVCQRLRESRETARIPVLLTVGKLEPFKPEEARRVKADAFIVKPFEASELLTALTKLEDRIVPQPAPYKPGRFAKAMSALEADGASNEYGDADSGWKNRLRVPLPVPKSHGRELETEDVAKPAEPQKADTRNELPPTAAAVPRDITPDEIAAINAAAAAFENGTVQTVAEPEAHAVAAVSANEIATPPEVTKPEMVSEDEPPATFATAASVENQPDPERVETESGSESPNAAEAVTADVVPNAASEIQPPTEQVATAIPPVAFHKPEERDEFAAALETLVPANGNGPAQQFSGPRWIAESISVTETESALMLELEMQKEQEMQKAHEMQTAAAAIADTAETNPPAAAADDSTFSVVQEAHQEVDESPTAEYAIVANQEGNREGNHEVSPSLMAAMTEAQPAVTINEAAFPTLSDLVNSVLPQSSAEPTTQERQGEAFAAAAAVGGDAVSQSTVPSEVSYNAGAPSNLDERQRESELAAAWESWKHIRESVVEPQFKSLTADAVAETHTPQAETVSAAQSESEDDTATQEEAGAIASIVDSVLADLKPKLMEEISRKMGKEKKRK
jgi:CheY-like chemotaxis protein